MREEREGGLMGLGKDFGFTMRWSHGKTLFLSCFPSFKISFLHLILWHHNLTKALNVHPTSKKKFVSVY